MKKLFILLTLLLGITLLYSCTGGGDPTQGGGGDTPPADEPDELLFSALVNAGKDGEIDVSPIVDAYYAAKGKMITVKNGATEVGEGEIIVGETARRPASSTAAGILYGELDAMAASDAEGYIIYAKDGSVAVVWSHDYFAGTAIAALIEKVVNADLTELPDGELAKLCTSLSAYRESARWGELEAIADPAVVAALKDLYAFIAGDDSSRIYTWMANLYDPETGAFYYANSARDYEGFGPDLESTVQLLQFLGGMGLFGEGKSYVDALPKELKTKLGDWAVSLQDADGYFYHPQWGRTAGQSRLGRDLMWATSLLDALGRTPKYKTPYETSASITLPLGQDKAVAVSAVVGVAEADYLGSAEKFSEYLEQNREKLLGGTLTSHSLGHTLNAVQDVIFSRGYGDILFDFFDSIQSAVYEKQLAEGKTPTGLWEDGVTYTSMSGLMKIADMYGTRREIKHRDLIVDSAIAANLIPADDPTMRASAVIYVFNPWAGIARVVNNAKRFGTPEELETIYEKNRESAAAMIATTKAKLAPFMHEDGSLSYNDTGLSAHNTQGVEVSLGLNEGDVNGTVLGINGITTNIFAALGYEKVPLWDEEDARVFVDILLSLSPMEKLPRPTLPPVDFEDNAMTNVNASNLTASGSTAEIVDDPYRGANLVLAFTSVSYTKLKTLEMTVRGEQTNSLKVFETEMCIGEDCSGAFKIMIDSLYLVEVIGDEKGYYFRQNVTTGSEESAKAHQIVGTDESGNTLYVQKGRWFKIRIECDLSAATPVFRVFVDTDLTDDAAPTTPIITGTSYMNIHKGSAMSARFQYMKIMTNSKTVGTYYFDNVLVTTFKTMAPEPEK